MILQNTVVDMMWIMQELHVAGKPVSAADVAFMSPYGTTGVKRFGNYHLDLKRPPEPWLKESLFCQAAKTLRFTPGGLSVQPCARRRRLYGRLDRAALLQAQHTYETTILLRMVEASRTRFTKGACK
ncbi:hypothetical protein AWV80_40530 [Cupriavidus sp. UYMU48A]|nr:hypothetical protein AWV80_40530 [Cupriavidus sp. UYMU48A]